MISRDEWEFWSREAATPVLDDGTREFFLSTIRKVFPRIASRVVLLDGDREIVPGVRTVSAPGHTAGHLGLSLRSDASVCSTSGTHARTTSCPCGTPNGCSSPTSTPRPRYRRGVGSWRRRPTAAPTPSAITFPFRASGQSPGIPNPGTRSRCSRHNGHGQRTAPGRDARHRAATPGAGPSGEADSGCPTGMAGPTCRPPGLDGSVAAPRGGSPSCSSLRPGATGTSTRKSCCLRERFPAAAYGGRPPAGGPAQVADRRSAEANPQAGRGARWW
jgi:hypothetical protein